MELKLLELDVNVELLSILSWSENSPSESSKADCRDYYININEWNGIIKVSRLERTYYNLRSFSRLARYDIMNLIGTTLSS